MNTVDEHRGPDQATVVLAGAGHANLVVLDYWRGRELPFHLVVIDPGQFAYSGMATGVVAGDYAADEASVDPRPMVDAVGGELIRDRITGIDRAQRLLTLDSGRVVPFDLLSLNIGSWVGGAGTVAPRVYPIKPISEVHRLARDLETSEDIPEEVVVIGGGVSGAEIACCAAARLARMHRSATVTLVHAQQRVAPQLPPRGRRLLRQALADRGVRVLTGRRLEAWHGRVARLDNGDSLLFTRLVLAPGLEPNPILEGLDLPVTDRGLVVDDRLRCPGDRRIFAAGDCADIQHWALPNIGVYGVRAAAVLAENLEAAVLGRPLQHYRPQRQYLSILNLGNGRALAVWDGLAASGPWALTLKDWIDRRFVERFR